MRRTVIAVTLAAIWITTFGVLDATRSDVTFFGSLAIASVGVSLFAPAWAAFGVWLYAFGWSLALGVDGERWNELHILRLAISAFVGGSAVAVAFLRERREHRFETVTAVATATQRALLRDLPARLDGARISVRYLSAAEDALVGGDLYEAMATPHGVRVIVGDVAGRGLPAVGLSGLVLGAFREAALSAPDLAELARRLDATVRAFTDGDEYATALMIELRGREVRLVSCGHPPPLLLDGGEIPVTLQLPAALPLGYAPEPEITVRTLRQGERLVLHTDGLTEARDPAGRFFDLATDGAAALAVPDADDALDALLVRLDVHTGGQLEDDVAVVIVEPGER